MEKTTQEKLVKHRTLILAGMCVLLCVVAGVYVYMHSFVGSYSNTDPAFNAPYWKHQIQMRGGEKAYAAFKIKNATAPSTRNHFAAHVFGSMVAEVQGVEGVAVCDPSFGYGCFHGFFSKIISTSGESSVQKLDSVCVEKFGVFGTGCQHGIGHGILEYVGYERIPEALSLCELTTQKVPLLGCPSGVFMEYFSPLVQKGEVLSQGRREFSTERPYAPCDTVSDKYKESCFFEYGHWVYTHFSTDQEKLVQICTGVPQSFRPYCYLGIGDVAGPTLNYSSQQATGFCDAFPPYGRMYCRAGVSWSFFANNPAVTEPARAVCMFGNDSEQKECMRYADLTEGQTNQ